MGRRDAPQSVAEVEDEELESAGKKRRRPPSRRAQITCSVCERIPACEEHDHKAESKPSKKWSCKHCDCIIVGGAAQTTMTAVYILL